MNCESARDLLFAAQEHSLPLDEQAALHEHLASCVACRAEEVAIAETSAVLAGGLRAMTRTIEPSAAFWHSLSAGLDAVDAERVQAPVQVPAQEIIRPAQMARAARIRSLFRVPVRPARRLAGAVVLVAALLSGLIATGGLQQAYAALRDRLTFLPAIGVGQVESTALIASAPVTGSNGSVRLTVTGLVAGRQATLLAYQLTGSGLLQSGNGTRVADAVQAVLTGTHGRRYVSTYALPVTRGREHGVPTLHGLLAFAPVAPNERSLRLEVRQLPLTPIGRPWSMRIALQPVGASASQTSIPLDQGDTHHGIRLTVTDLTLTAQATIVDMATQTGAGPYAGSTVVSLEPGQAFGDHAPVLSSGGGKHLMAAPPLLPLGLRVLVLPRPEFVFGTVSPHAALTLRIPAVDVRMPGAAQVTLQPGSRQPSLLKLGAVSLLLRGQVVTPPAGLGLDGEQRLRLTLHFPAGSAGGTLQSASLVVNGLGYTVSRNSPQAEIPLPAGLQPVQVTVENPVFTLHGPWVIALRLPGRH